MTRFDAATPSERRALIADAAAAHRQRASPYFTVEADGPPDGPESERPAWVQYRVTDGLLNLDCTDEELDRLSDVLDSYPEFTIEARESPEDTEGTNVRIQAFADDDRLATAIEDLYRSVYGYDREFRLWVVAV